MTHPGRSTTPVPVAIDACCLIDLLASGRADEIMRAGGFAWHLPVAVQGEVKYERRYDPEQTGAILKGAANLAPYIASGLLTPCQPDDPHEQARFIHYATVFRSDGEAMCLALAESRGWTVATDDTKAIKVGSKAGLTVISCPQVVKVWADANRPDAATISQVLGDIQTLAQFRPNLAMPDADWWERQLASTT